MSKKEKFTTTLNSSTIDKLELLRANLRINKDTGKRIRGLNEIIEILVDEKWGEISNDKDKK